MNSAPLLLLTAALLISLAPNARAADDIAARDAWVRAAPPGATVLAAYLVIDNPSAKPQILRGVSSPQFDSVEIHRTQIKDGVASMGAQPRVAIAAHSKLSFTPNGYHLMLIGPHQALYVGESVELRLQFDGLAIRKLHATVRAEDASDSSMPPQPTHH